MQQSVDLYMEKVLHVAWPWPTTLDISSRKCASLLAQFVKVGLTAIVRSFTYAHKYKRAYFYEVRGNKVLFVPPKYNSFLLA